MDKDDKKLSSDIDMLVEKYLGDFLRDNNFLLEERFVLDNRKKTGVVFCSPSCKLYFYKSMKDGEVNCLVGKPSASSKTVDEEGWFYINSILRTDRNRTIEELLEIVPIEPRSYEAQLLDLSEKIRKNYEALVKFVSD